MRMLATIVVQPHIKKKLAPKDLLPLPWEQVSKHEIVPLQKDKERLEKLMAKLNGKRN